MSAAGRLQTKCSYLVVVVVVACCAGCTRDRAQEEHARAVPFELTASPTTSCMAGALWLPDGGGRLILVDTQTGKAHEFALDSRPAMLALSPDGHQLAFVASRASGEEPSFKLCTVPTARFDQQNVRVLASALCMTGVAWAPDSNSIAFGVLTDAGQREIRFWQSRSEGSTPASVPGCDLFGMRGAWSRPDYLYVQSMATEAADRALVRVHLPDGHVESVVASGSPSHVAISPGDRYVAFPQLPGERAAASPEAGSSGLAVVVRALDSDRTVAQVDHVMADPVWSPDGTRLAFLRRADEGLVLCLLNVPGGQVSEIRTVEGVSTYLPPLDWASTEAILLAKGVNDGEVWSVPVDPGERPTIIYAGRR